MYVYCFSLNHIWVTIYCASKFVFCFKKRKCKPVAACSLGRKGQSGGRTFEKEKSEKLNCGVEKIERIYSSKLERTKKHIKLKPKWGCWTGVTRRENDEGPLSRPLQARKVVQGTDCDRRPPLLQRRHQPQW